MVCLRKYPQIFIYYLTFLQWFYEDNFLLWSVKIKWTLKLGVSKSYSTIRFCYELLVTCLIKIKQTLNINGWWLCWQIFSESKEVPGINGSIWEDYLCGPHPIASIVCVGSVDSHLDQFLVEFGSKHIRTLLNWKPVNTYSLNIDVHPLKNKHSIYEIMKFKTEMTRGGKKETNHIYYTEIYGLHFSSKPQDTPNLHAVFWRSLRWI